MSAANATVLDTVTDWEKSRPHITVLQEASRHIGLSRVDPVNDVAIAMQNSPAAFPALSNTTSDSPFSAPDYDTQARDFALTSAAMATVRCSDCSARRQHNSPPLPRVSKASCLRYSRRPGKGGILFDEYAVSVIAKTRTGCAVSLPFSSARLMEPSRSRRQGPVDELGLR
jgi:hypothetical protein